MKNLFCDRAHLSNEASVERLFVDRLLQHLGYKDAQILPKTSIEELPIGKGSKRLRYKPDYVLVVGRAARWVIDAKAPSENLDNWTEQCASYCLAINSRLKPGQPRARYFMLTNGLEARVHAWDDATPRLVLNFADFMLLSTKLQDLEALLGVDAVKEWDSKKTDGGAERMMNLARPTSNSINAVFSECNNYIYKHDNISQAAAFNEFVKVIFLKIKADKELHRKFPAEMRAGEPIPASAVTFSAQALDQLESQTDNPLDVQFQKLREALELEVVKGHKKRIFDISERINLQPDTAKEVVRRLQHLDLFGIDEDLNGRLFEAFLSATMRGRDLGQYFTPRSVVKLMTRLADPRIHADRTDRVIDPCCGSGGFLIEAMAALQRQVNENMALSGSEQQKLHKFIREKALFGVDVGRDPPVARIARINMYLHGDGGSRIYLADALDKKLDPAKSLAPELSAELSELRKVFSGKDGEFDIVLTNPPFSKEYDPKVPRERRILKAFDVAKNAASGNTLKSNVLFIERYRDLVRPGGKVLAIVDDSLLAGDSFRDVRKFIHANFIVRAVVSLPGDAFQRSGARVKTSVLYLTKRKSPSDQQPAVFMYYCRTIGVDDSARQRPTPDDAARRQAAADEVEAVIEAFKQAQSGADKRHLVDAALLVDRLDVKNYVVKKGRRAADWQSRGLEVGPLSRWASRRKEVWVGEDSDVVRALKVTYDGRAEFEEKERDTLKYRDLYLARGGDIVVSHINAVHGAACVIPPELDGAVVSTEYTVLTPNESIDAYALWAVLRSPEVRADMLASTSGHGRHRIDSDLFLALQVPRPADAVMTSTANAFRRARELEEEAERLRAEAQEKLEEETELTSDEAHNIIAAFKPPR
ncbi:MULTISPECIES: N-6 DNA methylase [unclassified Corallococcus]|uniref:N-6 DNA methylase n=1 Tax=unclassified Corallococcus TaxID=2685029 RepID=UPI001A903B41|nr:MULTISPECIES: N-6 DNA methylase [unclassified Corallococcus]MBN9685901.1 N-6 DNA methylase [Corallococcus sp. NCSPR001]WAS82659.1 N-6 DNA methylase [Corallococcus sp. NCRR]